MTPAAKASVNALMVHSSRERLACRSRWIAGNAVTTTNVSSATMKKASDVSTRVQVGRDRATGNSWTAISFPPFKERLSDLIII